MKSQEIFFWLKLFYIWCMVMNLQKIQWEIMPPLPKMNWRPNSKSLRIYDIIVIWVYFFLNRLYSKNIIAARLSAHTKVEKVTNSFKNSSILHTYRQNIRQEKPPNLSFNTPFSSLMFYKPTCIYECCCNIYYDG